MALPAMGKWEHEGTFAVEAAASTMGDGLTTVAEDDTAVSLVVCRDQVVLRWSTPEPPLECLDIALFRFFSSTFERARMVPSWSIVALTRAFYIRSQNRIRQSCS
jgi:hypothetical protein